MADQSPDMRAAKFARARDGVLSSAELHRVGIHRDAIRRRVAKGVLWPIHQGVFAFGTPEVSRRGQMRAAVLTSGPGAFIGFATGAELWGLIDERITPVDVLLLNRKVRRARLRVHRTSWLPEGQRSTWHGLPVTSVARTLLDAGTCLDPADHELAVAGALRRKLVTLEELQAMARTARPGSPTLAAQLTRAGGPQFTRSRAERILLGLVREAGVRPPDANRIDFGDERDLVWREEQVVVEFDGFGFHWSPQAKANDTRRDGDLLVRGWRTLRLTWVELTEEPTGCGGAPGGGPGHVPNNTHKRVTQLCVH